MAVTPVKIMQHAVAKTGELKIDCIGVGVGILLHSPSQKIAAGIHILAPNSATPTPTNPTKFANSAIPYVLEILGKEGVSPPLTVAIAGGASMEGSPVGASMGSKVVDAVKEAISKAKLKVDMEETGGSKIRTISLNIETGKIDIT